MARKIHNNHSKIKELHFKQYLKDPDNHFEKGTVRDGKSKILDNSEEEYYLEFQIPGNRYCTVNFDKTYGVKKFTRKKDDDNPQNDRLIFRVVNLNGPFDGSKPPKPADDDVEVKEPDNEPFIGNP